MFATDFIFDNQRASDLGLMVCSFNGDFGAASGGNVEYNVAKTPGRDKFTFYGSQFSSAIEWNFSICKNPCKSNTMYFNQYEESMVAKWLIKTDGYRFLQFDQKGYEDIFYNVCFNASPHQESGRTVGFDLVATSDCAYGFTGITKRKATISQNTPFILNIHSDVNTYILPVVTVGGEGDFYVKNKNDMSNKETQLCNLSKSEKIIMDSDNDTIKSIPCHNAASTDDHINPTDFNWHFMRLVDGENNIITNSAKDVEIEIQYREPRLIKI